MIILEFFLMLYCYVLKVVCRGKNPSYPVTKDQAPYFDDRLLSRRRNVAQAVENLEESERTLNEIKTATARRRNETNRENERGATWASI
jgi:hypothetical protein